MSAILLLVIFLGLFLLLAALGTLHRRIFTGSSSRGSNQLALVPAASGVQRGALYDPLEQSSWHKSIRPHIRFLARYIHVPPDFGVVMPEELYRHMQVLAMLQDQFRAGHLQRSPVSGSVTDLDRYRN
ncbi:uncharacterized protein LOC120457168 [Drosophila santomea]|uniref:uncharacterized protein LOC120457168 n=1 Tax=Drosophila santomea TaxID=129105 RepID=UPI001952A0DC|nr:uncharacterized protein LOC120457168 [Drosophila santomea]XP_039500384.1 uncharacterized protein LOC120457168 [Drosophila santomea]